MKSETTTAFHNDTRETVVLIEGKIFELVSSTQWNWEGLCQQPPESRPHVRTLSPIPVRSKAEQEEKNVGDSQLHELWKRIPQGQVTPLSKAKKAIHDGGKLPDQIADLLKQAKEARSKGDIKLAKKIRKALRKLDYKRYEPAK